MDYALESDGQLRLEEYFERIGKVPGDDKRCAFFATYAIGLLSDGAARACADPCSIDAEHQGLAHSVINSSWRDKDVRREAAVYALDLRNGVLAA